MTTGDKVGKLIDALEEGFILYKEFKHGEKMFFIQFEEHYEVKGWASALVSIKDCLFEITQSPDDWKVFPNFNVKKDEYPYPWSTKWEEK